MSYVILTPLVRQNITVLLVVLSTCSFANLLPPSNMPSLERKSTLPTLHPCVSITILDDEPTPTTDAAYTRVLTPQAAAAPAFSNGSKTLRVNKLVYTSAYLAMMQAILYGWSLSLLNYSKFNNKVDCDRRPIAPGTCLMFPGHTSTEWIFVVNSWVVGGIVGGLLCGLIADRIGRKSTLMLNCAIIALGAVIQAASPTLLMFCIGRFVTGIATGVATAICTTYVSEISPPHLRSVLGTIYVVAIGTGVFLVGLTPFFAATSSGWRYIAAFPIIIAFVFVSLAPKHLVESPSWLMARGRPDEAQDVLAMLYGEENIDLALSWIKLPVAQSQVEPQTYPPSEASAIRSLVSKEHRRKLILAVVLALAMQFSGINAVFFYSSTMFKEAGIQDGRIGSLIVNIFNLLPAIVAGQFVKRIGNRRGLLLGPSGMLVSAIGLTIARVHHISVLSIVFISTYVISFTICLGALAFPVGASLFPQSLRATGTSIMMFTNWCGALTIGVGYPFLSASLDEYAFVPFIGTLSFFVIFFYVFLPDTTSKTPAEIQELFE